MSLGACYTVFGEIVELILSLCVGDGSNCGTKEVAPHLRILNTYQWYIVKKYLAIEKFSRDK